MTLSARRGPRCLLLLLPLLLCHCNWPFDRAHAPYLNTYYARIGAGVASMEVEVGNDSSDFPYPLGEVQFGSVLLSEETWATSAELGGQIFQLDPGGELGGTAYRALLGIRQTYGMDEQLRFSGVVGPSWLFTNFKSQPSRFDVAGPGGFVGLAADYFLSPWFSVGLEGRYHLIYTDSHHEHDIVGAGDAVLRFTYHF